MNKENGLFGDVELKLEAFEKMGDILELPPRPEALAKFLVATIANAIHISACSFSLVDEKKNLCRMAAIGSNISKDYFIRIEQELCQKAIKSEKHILKTMVPKEAPSQDKEPRFYLANPILFQEEVAAVVFVRSLHQLKPKDIRFLSSLSHQALLAIENSRLAERREFEEAEFLALLEIGNVIASQLDVHGVIDVVANTAVQLVRGDTVSVILVDELSGELEVKAFRGLDQQYIDLAKKRDDHPIAKWVIETSTPVLLQDVSKDGRFKDIVKKGKRRKIKSVLCVPIKAKDRVIGALSVSNIETDQKFDKDDLRFLTILAEQAGISMENARLYSEMRDLYLGTIQALVFASEIREKFVQGHSDRVTKYAVDLARKLKLASKHIENIRYAGILHDIGKINIPKEILSKSSPLSAEERKEIEKHPQESAKILQSVRFLDEIVPIVWHHHERFDGAGYTDELSGEDIPLGARILAIADAYEAMISKRSYRKSMTKKEAIAELKKYSGSQFDPKLVDVFLSMLAEEKS